MKSTLTKIEQKVLQLVADGKKNREIANSFSRSVRTIENHRFKIYRKLDVSNTAGVVRKAIALGLVS